MPEIKTRRLLGGYLGTRWLCTGGPGGKGLVFEHLWFKEGKLQCSPSLYLIWDNWWEWSLIASSQSFHN